MNDIKNIYQKRSDEEMYFYYGDVGKPITSALMGITYPSPEYEMRREISKCFSIEYVYDGNGVIQHGDKIYKVSAGDCFILHQNYFHHYFSDPKKPWKKIWLFIEFNCDFVSHLIKDYGLKDVVHIKNYNNPTKFEKCLEVVKNSTDYREGLEFPLHELIADISNFYAPQKNSKYSIAYELKELLEKNINTQFKMSDAYPLIGMGKSQINALFKNAFNVSPMEYYTSLKINAIKSYLEQTDISMTTLSENYGFKNVFHFSTYFKKAVGISPTEYRKKFKPH